MTSNESITLSKIVAQAITNQAGSLTARVIVNRIWSHYFGQGLVTTPSNFGQLGSRPSHPNLLDDLTFRFMQNGWSLKWLHREIVTSSTYKQSVRTNPRKQAIDPENRLLSRMSRRRLHVEAWRDAMLSVTGQLDQRLGGKSLAIGDPLNRRRTLYATVHRRDMSQMLQIHDVPEPTAHSPKRIHTTTPLQGLFALNGSLLASQAEALCDRICDFEPQDDDVSQTLRSAYWLLFSREPNESELKFGLEFVQDKKGATQREAWIQYFHVLLALNEFLFID